MEFKDNNTKTNYILVEKYRDCIRIVEEVLLKEDILALDCEGIFLSKNGRLTLLQLATLSGEVYIFDILKGGSLMFLGLDKDKRGLKAVLENKNIVKVIHDCRCDWESLLFQYEIRLHNFIDTQEAYFVYKLFYEQEIVNPISLSNFLAEIQGVKLNYKSQMKSLMSENPEFWGDRPLDNAQLSYAAEDVSFLILAWMNVELKLNKNLLEMAYFMSIIKVVNSQMFDQFKEHLISSVLHMIQYRQSVNKQSQSQSGQVSQDEDQSMKSGSSANDIAYILKDLVEYDYVDNFFQFKSIIKNDNNKEDQNNIVNVAVSYKSMQRDYFERLIKLRSENPTKQQQTISNLESYVKDESKNDEKVEVTLLDRLRSFEGKKENYKPIDLKDTDI